VYCGETCRDEARYLRELEKAATYWRDSGYPKREAHVRGVIVRRLAAARA
jgi:hypothetical protein